MNDSAWLWRPGMKWSGRCAWSTTTRAAYLVLTSGVLRMCRCIAKGAGVEDSNANRTDCQGSGPGWQAVFGTTSRKYPAGARLAVHCWVNGHRSFVGGSASRALLRRKTSPRTKRCPRRSVNLRSKCLRFPIHRCCERNASRSIEPFLKKSSHRMFAVCRTPLRDGSPQRVLRTVVIPPLPAVIFVVANRSLVPRESVRLYVFCERCR